MSKHFTLAELCRSQIAAAKHIDNTPPPDIAKNLAILADELDQIRELLGNHPIRITSGYRCPALNRLVSGAKHSAHLQGWAADFICPNFGNTIDIVRAIVASDAQFDKIVNEGTWVHISFDPRARRIALTAHFTPNGTIYRQLA